MHAINGAHDQWRTQPERCLATGVSADGLTWGTVAAEIIGSLIAGRGNRLVDLLSPRRLRSCWWACSRRRCATDASLAFNRSGILGASLAPYVATRLALDHGPVYVDYYLAAAAILTLAAVLALPRHLHT